LDLAKKEYVMIVQKCMSKNVELGKPEMTLFKAAKKMRDNNIDILPVEHNAV
jgi:CBS domain-containing protein